MRQYIFLICFIVVVSVIAADSSSQESAEKKEGGSSYTTKIPIESVAVARKKTGEDKADVAIATKLVATATKSTIVAIENDGKKEEEAARARRETKSSESLEDLKEAAVDQLKHGDKHAAGPNESDMAAGDPVKLEAKPVVRARRFA
uniref:Uncharacterized protein n=1 Tax=Panagrolaimus sp. ES5 TaxID=591445 RepID=A0AC34GC88_9BILA